MRKGKFLILTVAGVLLVSFMLPFTCTAEDITNIEDTSNIVDGTETGMIEQERLLSEVLQDNGITFIEKMRAMSEETELYSTLTAVSEDVIRSFAISLSAEESYQYTIFMQYQFLMSIVREGALAENGKETLDFTLNLLKENSDLLIEKSKTASMGASKEELEQSLFVDIFAEKYKDVYYAPDDGREAKVKNFADLRSYLARIAPDSINIEEIYIMLGCYRGETEENEIEGQQDACAAYIASLYKTEVEKQEGGSEIPAENETNQEGRPTEDQKALEMGSEEETMEEESKAQNEKQAEAGQNSKSKPILPVVKEEAGEGILEEAACRTIDALPEPVAFSGGLCMFSMENTDVREEKYYEVYARTSGDDVKRLEAVVSVQGKSNTYEAEKGSFELNGGQYNWRLRLPYEEIPLEGTDGIIRSSLTAENAEKKVRGRAMNLTQRASGIYSDKKQWVGSDFTKLNTNKNTEQVYYVYGTVYTDDFSSHQIYNISMSGAGKYSRLSISSYDAERARVILRTSGNLNKGTWIALYGRIELNNLDILGCGGNAGEWGLIAVENPGNVTAATKQSYLSMVNCSLSNANKWAVHGDRNSYLNIEQCSISKTKGGVGGHGEINMRYSTLDNTQSPYAGRAGVHLNVIRVQGGIRHSVHLENNIIKGYPKGIEYQVSNFFSNMPIGNKLESLDMASTGSGNSIVGCAVGVNICKNGVDIPVSVDLQNSLADVSSCNVGIQTENGNDTFKISGGDVHNNTIGTENIGTFVMSGGNIYSNATGIHNLGNASVEGGVVRHNTTGADNSGSLTVSGGQVYGNTSQGIYQNGSFWFTGGQLNDNTGCDVYLETGHVIDWNGQAGTVTRINSRNRELGTELVRNQSPTRIGQAAEDYFDVVHGGRYTDRGGDRNGSAWGSLVLSEFYTVTYLNNTYGEITDMPDDGVKFWKETYTVPDRVPVNKSYSYIRFRGWSSNEDGIADIYPGSKLDMDKDIVLKSVWKDSIIVRYFPNGGTGEAKENTVTYNEILNAGGYYTIRENAGYADFAREGYTYVGFDFDSKCNPAQTAFRGGNANQVSLTEMLEHTYEADEQPFVDIYAIWDRLPEITFQGVNEYYEGTDVGRADLKSNVTAQDQEDGDITDNLRIVEIRYAEGKLVDGVPAAGQTVSFDKDMSETDKLDTWFMSLDKEKSPIVHTIVYEVADTMGGVTRAEHEVKVKYNEFPEIVAEDRYFTVEEALNGTITEELLIKDAVEHGKVRVTDAEEDVRDPEYIKSRLELINFVPEEFSDIKYGGMVTLEYTVKDSMGPEGEGKETRQKVKIYVMEEGEIPQKPETSLVRFINEKNYRKNEGKADMDLTSEEKEELNKNGGLQVDSIWLTDPESKALIERCFGEGTEPQEIYGFSKAEVERAKKFIEENGIGNSQEPSALSRFMTKFMD